MVENNVEIANCTMDMYVCVLECGEFRVYHERFRTFAQTYIYREREDGGAKYEICASIHEILKYWQPN